MAPPTPAAVNMFVSRVHKGRENGALRETSGKAVDCKAGVHHEAARRVADKRLSYGNVKLWPNPYSKELTCDYLSSLDPGRCCANACERDSQSTKLQRPCIWHLDVHTKVILNCKER